MNFNFFDKTQGRSFNKSAKTENEAFLNFITGRDNSSSSYLKYMMYGDNPLMGFSLLCDDYNKPSPFHMNRGRGGKKKIMLELSNKCKFAGKKYQRNYDINQLKKQCDDLINIIDSPNIENYIQDRSSSMGRRISFAKSVCVIMMTFANLKSFQAINEVKRQAMHCNRSIWSVLCAELEKVYSRENTQNSRYRSQIKYWKGRINHSIPTHINISTKQVANTAFDAIAWCVREVLDLNEHPH